MARTDAMPSGRIKPSDADAVLIASLVGIAAEHGSGADIDVLLYLVERALPLTTSSTRMQALKPVAGEILSAAPDRQKNSRAAAWIGAKMRLQAAIARDAKARALALVEAA